MGQVRSLDKFISNPMPSGAIRRQFVAGRILKPGTQPRGGYQYVNLTRGGNRCVSTHVHRIVMAAFVGQLPDGMQTRHLNGNPADNRLENLCYGTRSENADDRIAHGTRYKARCKRGHEYSPENTRTTRDRNGYVKRDCRGCERDRYHERKAAK